MVQFHLVSEAELFACNMSYRLAHNPLENDKNVYIGDPGSKNEDVMKNLNLQRHRTSDKYKEVFH